MTETQPCYVEPRFTFLPPELPSVSCRSMLDGIPVCVSHRCVIERQFQAILFHFSDLEPLSGLFKGDTVGFLSLMQRGNVR